MPFGSVFTPGIRLSLPPLPPKVKDGLKQANLVKYPTVTTTSTDMADKEKFKFDPAEDVGKIFIETDTETAYVFDAKGNRKYVA